MKKEIEIEKILTIANYPDNCEAQGVNLIPSKMAISYVHSSLRFVYYLWKI